VTKTTAAKVDTGMTVRNNVGKVNAVISKNTQGECPPASKVENKPTDRDIQKTPTKTRVKKTHMAISWRSM
jgi:hypothetical protein